MVLDLSQYRVNDHELYSLMVALIGGTTFNNGRLLYQVGVLRRNLREHWVVWGVHHALFDRVSAEVLTRDLMRRYDELTLTGEPPHPTHDVDGPSFHDYVRQVGEGPVGTQEPEVIEAFQLVEFSRAKRQLLEPGRLRPANASYSFQVAVPCANHAELGCSLGCSVAFYARALRAVYGLDALPFLFVHDGRKYRGKSYYGVIGELIDFVPMGIDAALSPNALQELISERLVKLERCNINFLNLLQKPRRARGWQELTRLVDPGEAFFNMDVCMFNFLGNAPAQVSYLAHHVSDVRVDEKVLPLESFMNCIVASYRDGFVFHLRCSHETDVDGLREAFSAAAQSCGTAGALRGGQLT
jgi:hypothetical protein